MNIYMNKSKQDSRKSKILKLKIDIRKDTFLVLIMQYFAFNVYKILAVNLFYVDFILDI